jgi:hypothetical protein
MKEQLLNTLQKFNPSYLDQVIRTLDIYRAKRPKSETIYDFYINVLLTDYEGDVNSMDGNEQYIKQRFRNDALDLPTKFTKGHSKYQAIKQHANTLRNKQRVDYPTVPYRAPTIIDEPPKKV